MPPHLLLPSTAASLIPMTVTAMSVALAVYTVLLAEKKKLKRILWDYITNVYVCVNNNKKNLAASYIEMGYKKWKE